MSRIPYGRQAIRAAMRAQRAAVRAQRMSHRWHRRRAMVRVVPPPVLIVGGVVLVGLVITVIVTLLTIAVVVGALALPVLAAVGVTRSVRRRHRNQLGTTAGAAIGTRPAADPWQHAKSRFATLRSEYAAYECDALAVLRLPALADVTVPSTARFVEAFAEAQSLDADGPVPPAHRDRFVAAVEQAWRCWQAAREAAERIRLSHLSDEERSTVERVVRLLTTAKETDNDSERHVAYGRARNELAKLERTSRVRIPRPAQAKLDNAYRGQLPA